MIQLTREPLDINRLSRPRGDEYAGAAVVFVGLTRRWTDGQRTELLEYEAYEPMACDELEELEAAARRRWPIQSCEIVHRLGKVEVGQPSVAIAVTCPHRADAFAAVQWLINQIKHHVPIWKQEMRADGSGHWVHPGVTESTGADHGHSDR